MTVTDWIQAISSVVNAVLVFVLVVATVYYALRTAGIAEATKQQAAEMRESRELDYRPELALWRVPIQIKTDHVILKVENVGNGPTIDIKVEAWWREHYWEYDAVSALSGREIREYTCVSEDTMPLPNERPGDRRNFVVRLTWRHLNGKDVFKRVHAVTEEELDIGQADIEVDIRTEKYVEQFRAENS